MEIYISELTRSYDEFRKRLILPLVKAHRIFQVSGGGSVPGFSRTGFPVRISAGRPPACPLCHPVYRQR